MSRNPPAEESYDGSIHTPAVGNGPSGIFERVANIMAENEARRERDETSEAEEDTDPLLRTIYRARDYERQHFVQRLEGIYEDENVDNNELRDREREAIRNHRANGRATKVSCFMCHYGNYDFDSTADKGSQPFVRIRNMIRSRYAYSDLDTLSMDCAEIYHHELREPSRQPDGTYLLPEMLPSDFALHIVHHNLNPQIMVGQDLRFTTELLGVLRMQLGQAKGSMGLKIIDCIIKVMKQRTTYLSLGGRALVFESRTGADPLALDPTQMGDVANMGRVYPYLASARTSAIGGATATNTSRPRQGLPRFDRMEAAVGVHDVDEPEPTPSSVDTD
jgi:hypothetical protein